MYLKGGNISIAKSQLREKLRSAVCRTEECSQPEYYNAMYGLVGTLAQSTILLVGVLGTFSRKKQRKIFKFQVN